MKMEHSEMILTRLLFLLFLSAKSSIEVKAFNVMDYLEGSDYIGTRIMRRNKAEDSGCRDYNEIARWINDQVVHTAKLTTLNQRLSSALRGLNGSLHQSQCYFYEENTVAKIFQHVNEVIKGNGTLPLLPPQQASGELGQDLDNILNAMKTIFANGMKTCCENLYDVLKKLEEDLLKQLNDLKNGFDQITDKSTNERAELQKKQVELENQLNNLRSQLDQLEKQMNNSLTITEDKCFEKLDNKVQQLNKMLEDLKHEIQNQNNELEKQIKDLESKQQDQANKLDGLTAVIEHRNESIVKLLSKCEKSCNTNETSQRPPDSPVIPSPPGNIEAGSQPGGSGNPGNGYGSQGELGDLTSTSCNLTEVEQQITDLKKLINLLSQDSEEIWSAEDNSSNSATTNNCEILKQYIIQIENRVKQLLENRSDSDGLQCTEDETLIERSRELVDQLKILQAQLEKANKCCTQIDQLIKKREELSQSMKQMNNSHTEQKKQMEADMQTQKERMDGALERINKLNAKLNDKLLGVGQNDKCDETEIKKRLDTVKEKLERANEELLNISSMLDNVANNLSNFQNDLNVKFTELDDVVSLRATANNDFFNNIEKRLEELGTKLKQECDDKVSELLRLLDKLEKLNEQLAGQTDKALQEEKQVGDLEQQVKTALEHSEQVNRKFEECLNKCENSKKLEELLARIQELEGELNNMNTLATSKPYESTTSSTISNSKTTSKEMSSEGTTSIYSLTTSKETTSKETTRQQTTKASIKYTTKRNKRSTRKRVTVWIGGSKYVTNRYGPGWYTRSA